ncbi:MAG TPA: peptide chain release factor N(5)-glutamine methyltransferase [Nocardioidaceae bacterium]|nr:peptide chain release factor N(5)-glutamine methyltransferase [Nocardioidaceae bacterium]
MGGAVRRRVDTAATRLAEAGVPSPEYDAAQLLAHVLRTSRASLALVQEITLEQDALFDELVDRRVLREPLQHITGTTAFRYVEVAVGPGVFVPRPETELLAGWGIDRAREVNASGRPPVVVDLGTGSGAMALAFRDEIPDAAIHAVELDERAYGWALRNLGGTDVDLRRGDMADAFPDLSGTVDIVVCNPPYIPLEAFESVAVEARDFDPTLALWSGADGLDAMRVLETVGTRLLRPRGVLGAEHADAQADSAQGIFIASGRWSEVRDHLDLAGRSRFVTARLAR